MLQYSVLLLALVSLKTYDAAKSKAKDKDGKTKLNISLTTHSVAL